MDATILDLRYKMSRVIDALDNRECVNVLYHGKIKGTIVPAGKKPLKAQDQYFGSNKSAESVALKMKKLRGGRYRDL